MSEVLETLTREYVKKPGDRAAGYVNALLVLARSFSPTIFSAWGCLNRLGQNQSHPLIGMLVEVAESSTTTLSQLVHILKLIGLIFAGKFIFLTCINPNFQELLKMHLSKERTEPNSTRTLPIWKVNKRLTK